MKKMLALLVVFACASVAQAGLVIKADGVAIDLSGGHTIPASQDITIEEDSFHSGYIVTLDATDGIFDTSNVILDTDYDFGGMTSGAQAADHVSYTGASLFGTHNPGEIVSGLRFTNFTDRTLITVTDELLGQTIGSFVVTVPEPMTLALLSFGGLASLRRRLA